MIATPQIVHDLLVLIAELMVIDALVNVSLRPVPAMSGVRFQAVVPLLVNVAPPPLWQAVAMQIFPDVPDTLRLAVLLVPSALANVPFGVV